MEDNNRGVLQGLVLGPLMYTLYINKFPEVAIEDNCVEEIHNKADNLFNPNCKKCGQIPSYSDDATFVVSTKKQNPKSN